MKKVLITLFIVLSAAFLIQPGSVQAASQSANEAAIKHGYDACGLTTSGVGSKGDACEALAKAALAKGVVRDGNVYWASKKGEKGSVYDAIIKNSDLIQALVDCRPHSSDCMNDKYKGSGGTKSIEELSKKVGGMDVKIPSVSASNCRKGGGVPVSDAFGVDDNCIGGLQDDGSKQSPIFDLVSIILTFLLGILSLIMVAVLIYAGIRYITSGGNPDDVKSAKNSIKAVLTALVLLAIMYGLLQTILPEGSGVFR